MGDERVYLDHLIRRENLRYKRPGYVGSENNVQDPDKLWLLSLLSDHPYRLAQNLRKPDFQRSTAAWSPEECLALLESLTNRQTIPSIILWSSQEGPFIFILDGAHRVSVVLAWLSDDWGDNPSYAELLDPEDLAMRREAAMSVRALVNTKIGPFSAYRAAAEEQETIIERGDAPGKVMTPHARARAKFYTDITNTKIAFDTQYVHGDYAIAEKSFLIINRSGRKLSDWEIKIIQNRDSSFARTTMAVSSINSLSHYWTPVLAEDESIENGPERIKAIHGRITKVNSVLFTPAFQHPIRTLAQPYLPVVDRTNRPGWVAELLTVMEKKKGQEIETTKLLEQDAAASPAEIVANGERLVQRASDILDHLDGPATDPRSLAIVPALYFYSEAGRYSRGLLYGLIYWLFSGPDDDVFRRKLVFSAFRGPLETLLQKKDALQLTRRSGSGPDITVQTARYYQEALELLIAAGGDTSSTEFQKGYDVLVASISSRASRSASRRGEEPEPVLSRTFTPAQKSTEILRQLILAAPHCGICGGLFDPARSRSLQHDHILQRSLGGQTELDNQRLTHPFCNNNRERIEEIRLHAGATVLPAFTEIADADGRPTQLKLFDEDDF